MSAFVALSIVVRLVAILLSARLLIQLRDWRIAVLTVMLGFMAMRQTWTMALHLNAASMIHGGRVDELPGLIVSGLALLFVVLLGKMIRGERRNAQELGARLAELEQARTEVSTGARLLNTIIDAFPHNLIVRDREGRVLMVNSAWERFFECPRERAVGALLREIATFDGSYAEMALEADQPILAGTVATSVVEEPRRNGLGEERLLRLTRAALRDEAGAVVGVVVASTDITEAARSEQELRSSERLLEAVFDAIPFNVVVKDVDSRYIKANRAWLDNYNLEPGEVVGKHTTEISSRPEADREHAYELDRAFLTGSERVRTYEMTRAIATGERRNYLSSYAQIREEDTVHGLVSVDVDITDLIATQEALRANQRLLNAVIENVPIGICLKDPDGRYRIVNRAFASYVGREPQELLGQTSADMGIGTPEEIERVRASDRRVTETGQISNSPAETVTFPDGEVRWRRVVKVPLFDDDGRVVGIVALREDITDRMRAEAQVQESQRLLETVIETIPHGLYVKNHAGRYIMVNGAFLAMYRLRREEVIGRTAEELGLFAPERMEVIREHDVSVIEQGRSLLRMEAAHQFADGSQIETLTSISPLRNQDDAIVGLVGLSEDVTQHRKLESQLRRSQRLEAVGQLAGGVAHEFNNLLQVVTGFLELTMEMTDPSDERHRGLTRMKVAADRGAALVRQLLGFGRRGALRTTAVNCTELVQSLEPLLQGTLGSNIALRLELEPELPLIVADEGALEQVVMNLCINARDAMAEGGELTVQTETLTLDGAVAGGKPAAPPGRYVRISVQDTGHGIAERHKEHVFEPFFTTKGPQEGSGLGLAMVYGLVEQHHGAISFTSEPDVGTRFDIHLPVGDVAALQPRRGRPAERQPKRDETILVVEDEIGIQELTTAVLTGEGFTVLVAKDGDEAVQIFDAQSQRIALVLLDLVMPGRPSRDVLEHVRQARPDLPVILQTGREPSSMGAEFRDDGTSPVLRKPYTPDELRAAVHRALKPPGATNARRSSPV